MSDERDRTCFLGDHKCPVCGGLLSESWKYVWCGNRSGDGQCLFGLIERKTLADLGTTIEHTNAEA